MNILVVVNRIDVQNILISRGMDDFCGDLDHFDALLTYAHKISLVTLACQTVMLNVYSTHRVLCKSCFSASHIGQHEDLQPCSQWISLVQAAGRASGEWDAVMGENRTHVLQHDWLEQSPHVATESQGLSQ
jgi:hypothetical protein